MSMIIANDIPYADSTLDPLQSLEDSLAFASNDWAGSRAGAWIYGIVLGWENPDEPDDDDPPWTELHERFGWDGDTIDRLKALHAAFTDLRNFTPGADAPGGD